MPHEVDELFEVRNAFLLGNYQQCINEAQKLKSTNDETCILRDAYMYRAYIAQKKFSVPLSEISGVSAADLQAIKLLADYESNPKKRSKILEELEQKLSSGTMSENPVICLAYAMIYMRDRNFDQALRILHSADDLECSALSVQCLLKIDRPDMALKEVKKMHEKDEDATITQFATAWTNMAVGKEKLQDAFYIFQEMIDKYSSTSLLLNSQAACLIQQQKYDQAEQWLMEAMEKDSNNPETLINMICVTQLLGKPIEVCNRYISQLKSDFPEHPWTQDYLARENDFDRVTKMYEVSVRG